MSKKVLRTLGTVVAVAVNIFPLVGQIASLAITAGIGLLNATVLKPKSPRISPNATDRLFANLVPDAPRKIAFGISAQRVAVRLIETAR